MMCKLFKIALYYLALTLSYSSYAETKATEATQLQNKQLIKEATKQATKQKKSASSTREDVDTKSIESARIISCAIKFPLDSVRFSEEQITKCMKSANLDAISYIHVIATASSSGSTPHNLYLSTRRAGAIEAYLNNHYPKIQVHAFGGGENPKFGKVARIFVVENNQKPNEIAPGVQVATAGPPEVIEKTITKYITKTKYQDRPKQDINFYINSGMAKTDLSTDQYQYLSVKANKLFKTSIYMLNDFTLGLRARVLQSDYVSDVNSFNLAMGKHWNLYHLWKGDLYFEHSIELGQMKVKEQALEYGTSAVFGFKFKDIRLYTVATISNHIKSGGIGIVANI